MCLSLFGKKRIKLDLAGSLQPIIYELQPMLEKELKKKYHAGFKNGLIIGLVAGIGLALLATSYNREKP